MGSVAVESTQEIPKSCVGAVVKNEGPDFYVEIENLPVPEISRLSHNSPTDDID